MPRDQLAGGSRPTFRTSTTPTSPALPAARAERLAGRKKDELDTALGYFENNAPRMRYRWFRSPGLFVGSGVVEAGCKAVIGQRLKPVRHALDRPRRRPHLVFAQLRG